MAWWGRRSRENAITELPELADLCKPELGVLFLLPQIKARLAHADLAADICVPLSDLLIGKSLALHGPLSPVVEDF
jgi:hypothetical protein